MPDLIMFTDDTNLLRNSKNLNDLIKIANVLAKLVKWFNLNKLLLLIKKLFLSCFITDRKLLTVKLI